METLKMIINMNIEILTILSIILIMILITFLAYNVNNFDKIRIIFYTMILSLFLTLLAVLSLTGAI